MNKYNIKVGDYVETLDGKVGYIRTIDFCDKDTVIPVVFNTGHINNYKTTEFCFKNEPHRFFKRIGINDFTKKEFEPISKYNQNGIITYADKINEVIDHINAIQERLNEYDSTRVD